MSGFQAVGYDPVGLLERGEGGLSGSTLDVGGGAALLPCDFLKSPEEMGLPTPIGSKRKLQLRTTVRNEGQGLFAEALDRPIKTN